MVKKQHATNPRAVRQQRDGAAKLAREDRQESRRQRRRGRPLGASLPPELRLVAYERRIRELHEAVDDVVDALETLETGERDGRRVAPEAAYSVLRAAIFAMHDLREANIGRRETVRSPRTAEAAGR